MERLDSSGDDSGVPLSRVSSGRSCSDKVDASIDGLSDAGIE
jgi:hypothetical protein